MTPGQKESYAGLLQPTVLCKRCSQKDMDESSSTDGYSTDLHKILDGTYFENVKKELDKITASKPLFNIKYEPI